jgi:hypothetical protein
MPNPYGAARVVPFEDRTPASGARLFVERGDRRSYRNAQLDDYVGLPRSQFRNRPPLELTLRARFSHEETRPGAPGLQGTAGFGFWNDPFMMTDRRPPMLPRTLWFFYASPPSDMQLDLNTPGRGWKAAAIDALRPAAIGPALAAPLLIPLMRSSAVYRRVWPAIQRRLRISEALVPVPMTEWHAYTIEWGTGPRQHLSRFLVDGQLLLEAPSPRGPLGLVIWCDNQYMVAQPWGRLAHGLLETGEQWLEVAEIRIRV